MSEVREIEKKIKNVQWTLSIPNLKVSMRRHLLRRLSGLQLEFQEAIKKQVGVAV